MTTINKAPFLAITNVTNVMSQAAQDAVNARIQLVIDALTPVAAQSTPVPGFDLISPAQAVILVDELKAVQAAVDAAPTS